MLYENDIMECFFQIEIHKYDRNKIRERKRSMCEKKQKGLIFFI